MQMGQILRQALQRMHFFSCSCQKVWRSVSGKASILLTFSLRSFSLGRGWRRASVLISSSKMGWSVFVQVVHLVVVPPSQGMPMM